MKEENLGKVDKKHPLYSSLYSSILIFVTLHSQNICPSCCVQAQLHYPSLNKSPFSNLVAFRSELGIQSSQYRNTKLITHCERSSSKYRLLRSSDIQLLAKSTVTQVPYRALARRAPLGACNCVIKDARERILWPNAACIRLKRTRCSSRHKRPRRGLAIFQAVANVATSLLLFQWRWARRRRWRAT